METKLLESFEAAERTRKHNRSQLEVLNDLGEIPWTPHEKHDEGEKVTEETFRDISRILSCVFRDGTVRWSFPPCTHSSRRSILSVVGTPLDKELYGLKM